MNCAQPHGVAPGASWGIGGRRPVVAVSEASIIIENTPLQRNWRGTRRSRSSLSHLRTALRRAFIAPVIAENV